MQLVRENNAAIYQIKAYTASSITVNEQILQQSILIMPQHLELWHIKQVNDLQESDLDKLLTLAPELIILGTGQKWLMPNPWVQEYLYAHRIGLEIMDTPAACRTYTALTTEGRHVLAGIILDV